MLRVMAGLGLFLIAGSLGAEVPPGSTPKEKTPEALRAEIEALRPARHVWRAIAWKTCPLEALKASREQNKPVIAWVFLGLPTDERC